MPPDPQEFVPQHSTFTPAARMVYIHQLNHCIWHFQTLPKTLEKMNLQRQVPHPNNSAMLLPVSLNIISL